MKKILALGALLTLFFPAAALAQQSYPPYGFRVFTDWQSSNLRIEVTPSDAHVFVDKHYVGVASYFRGNFRRLPLHAGPHLVELQRDGYESLAMQLTVYAGQSITVAEKMRVTREDGDMPDLEAATPVFEEAAVLPAADGPSGALRFDLTLKDAAIYADGFYVGIVDDFNGSQHMLLTQGTHRLVLKRDGYETLAMNLTIDSERPVTFRAALTATRNTPVQVTASAATR